MYTAGQIWGFLIVLIGLILTILNIIEKAILLKARSKEPQAKLESRLVALETWRAEVNQRLDKDEEHFDKIDEGNKVTQQALLALMDAALSDDGSKGELKSARKDLYEYLSKK